MEGLGRSETRTSSQTSELGPAQSVEFCQDAETWSLNSRMTESITEWTDEKHSLYLKSMETSFVNQLYDSVDILRCNLLKRNNVTSSTQMHRTSSGQYKVLRGGCWQKINFERPGFQVNKAQDSHNLLASPWIRHFKSERRPQTLASPNPPGIAGSKIALNLSGKTALPCEKATSSEQVDTSHLCHPDLVGSNAEMSDQNFIDEEIKSEKGSGGCSSKKLKTEMNDISSHDQVVPLPHSKPSLTENGRGKCVFTAR